MPDKYRHSTRCTITYHHPRAPTSIEYDMFKILDGPHHVIVCSAVGQGDNEISLCKEDAEKIIRAGFPVNHAEQMSYY